MGVTAVLARTKALPIHTYPAVDRNEETIAGTAGVTIVRSSADNKTDRHRGIMTNVTVVGESFSGLFGFSCGAGTGAGWPLLLIDAAGAAPVLVGVLSVTGSILA